MLSEAKNKLLTEVEGDAPMGTRLRRYWHPICGSVEMKPSDVRPVRLFGENLDLYGDRGGTLRLVDRHCTWVGIAVLLRCMSLLAQGRLLPQRSRSGSYPGVQRTES